MSVYVDASSYAYGRMVMCHMIADTPDELHAMADRIGVARRWFQATASFPHYDIAKSKRELAVAAGALEVDRIGLVVAMRRIRASGTSPGLRVPGVKPVASGCDHNHDAWIGKHCDGCEIKP